MALNFQHLLSKRVDSAERPKPLPGGTYHGRVARYEFGESKEKKTPFVRYHIRLTAPGDDIDPDQLRTTNSKGQAAMIDPTKKEMRKDFYLTDDAIYRLREFMESCEIVTENRSFNETIPEVVNASVLVSVTQRPNKDNAEEVFNDIDKIVGEK